jgi:hypothetical protein
MRTLPAILLVLAAARAEAWPENVYVAQSDGSISVLDGGGLTTNHTPRPFPTNLCRATDGAADPGGGVVWFVTRCGEAFTIDDHGLVTLKMPAPMPLSIFRTMRIAVDDMGTAYIASGQKKIDWISRDDTRSAIGTTGTVFEVVAGRGGLIHFHDATAQKLKTLDPVRGGSITDVGPLTGRPWLVLPPVLGLGDRRRRQRP